MNYRTCRDDELVAHISHDPDAAEELFRRQVRPLTRHVSAAFSHASHRAEDVNDVVSSTFLAAIESAHRFDPSRGTAAAWLIGIANNLVAAHRRRSFTEARAVLRFGGRRHSGADDFAATDERIDAHRSGAEVIARLNELPPAESALMRLLVEEGLTVSEAADVLGIRPATARMRLARARLRLSPHAVRQIP